MLSRLTVLMENKMKNKSVIIFMISGAILLIIACIFAYKNIMSIFVPREEKLSRIIEINLQSEYGMEFVCDSLGITGGGVFFQCHPVNDSTLIFDGFGDSESGYISYDTFPGAIIAKDDARLFEDYLDDRLGDVLVYGMPHVHGDRSISRLISSGEFTLDELHELSYYPHLYLYIVVNPYDDSYISTPDMEYDAIVDASNKLVSLYREKYNQEVCVNLRLFFLNRDDYAYAESYFETHISLDDDDYKVLKHSKEIVIEIGSTDIDQVYDLQRLSREEYIDKRERIK